MRWIAAATLSVALFGTTSTLNAEDATRPASAPYTVETMCGIVQPMKHSLEGRLPILLWWYPLPTEAEAVKWQQDGRLRKAVDELNKRGVAITPPIGDLSHPEGTMAIIRTLKEAGQPVYLRNQVGFRWDLKSNSPTLYTNAPTYRAPCAWNAAGEPEGTNTREWIAMTCYDTQPTVAMYKELMQRLKDMDIVLAAVLCDYEGIPHPWNFSYQAAKTAAGRPYYPAAALTSFKAFHMFTDGLHTKVLNEGIADPVHAAYPKALVGNYSDVPSSADYPVVDGNLAPFPPSDIGRMNVIMPSVYANSVTLRRFFNADWEVTQPDADNIYFTIMLQQLSAAGANKQPGQRLMPFIANWVLDDQGPRFRFGLSPNLYRELHRHALLRGTDGFYVFTTDGYYGRTPTEICEMVENTRAPYDEMLEYREFLDKGTPMNFEVPAIRTRGLIWSGLRLKDRCLVRAFTLAPSTRRLDFVPFPGVAVSVDAPPEGATYLIDKKRRVKKVGSGL